MSHGKLWNLRTQSFVFLPLGVQQLCLFNFYNISSENVYYHHVKESLDLKTWGRKKLYVKSKICTHNVLSKSSINIPCLPGLPIFIFEFCDCCFCRMFGLSHIYHLFWWAVWHSVGGQGCLWPLLQRHGTLFLASHSAVVALQLLASHGNRQLQDRSSGGQVSCSFLKLTAVTAWYYPGFVEMN